jgi:hypothetical protein
LELLSTIGSNPKDEESTLYLSRLASRGERGKVEERESPSLIKQEFLSKKHLACFYKDLLLSIQFDYSKSQTSNYHCSKL